MSIRRKIVPIISGLILVGSLTNATVAAKSETIYVQTNQVWNTRSAITSNSYATYFTARCMSVFPYAGTDNFTRIQVKVSNEYNDLTDTYVLYETAYNDTHLKLNDQCKLSKKTYFSFRGNDPDYDAYASVIYDAH